MRKRIGNRDGGPSCGQMRLRVKPFVWAREANRTPPATTTACCTAAAITAASSILPSFLRGLGFSFLGSEIVQRRWCQLVGVLHLFDVVFGQACLQCDRCGLSALLLVYKVVVDDVLRHGLQGRPIAVFDGMDRNLHQLVVWRVILGRLHRSEPREVNVVSFALAL